MPKKILIVEDHDDSRNFLKLCLMQEGYEIIEAVTGRQAVEVAESEFPNLILMDIDLPLMNGLTATRLIRANPNLSQTPIIAVTASAIRNFEVALEAGCNSALGKPVEQDDLLKMVKLFD